MKKAVVIFILLVSISFFPSLVSVEAKTLDEEITSQLNNVDFDDFNDFYSDLSDLYFDYNFFDFMQNVLTGNVNADYQSIFSYVFSTFFANLHTFIPIVLSVIAISLISGIISKLKSSFVSDGVDNVVSLICIFTVLTLIFNHVISAYDNAIKTMNTISKFNQVVSPILLTLMIASGGNVSASVYKPVVSMLSGTLINVFVAIIVPLSLVMTILSVVSNFSESIKINKFIELISSIIKWIIGICVTVFGIFLTTQGIVSSVHDGISLRATKYALSNSIPLVGGFISGGFDLVLSGSILIKNAIGISSVFLLFFIVLSPVLNMLALSFMLKVCAGFSECFNNSKISLTCTALSKGLTYFIASILMVGFMFFISILLMVFSANSFV